MTLLQALRNPSNHPLAAIKDNELQGHFEVYASRANIDFSVELKFSVPNPKMDENVNPHQLLLWG